MEDYKIQLNAIAQTIFDKKGFNILALDVRNVCTVTDFFIVAEGNVDRHVRSLSRAIINKLKDDFNLTPWHLEGISGDWVVIDYGDIVVHLLTPEMREKYAIEEFWQAGSVFPVNIDVSKHIK